MSSEQFNKIVLAAFWLFGTGRCRVLPVEKVFRNLHICDGVSCTCAVPRNSVKVVKSTQSGFGSGKISRVHGAVAELVNGGGSCARAMMTSCQWRESDISWYRDPISYASYFKNTQLLTIKQGSSPVTNLAYMLKPQCSPCLRISQPYQRCRMRFLPSTSI